MADGRLHFYIAIAFGRCHIRHIADDRRCLRWIWILAFEAMELLGFHDRNGSGRSYINSQFQDCRSIGSRDRSLIRLDQERMLRDTEPALSGFLLDNNTGWENATLK